MRYLFALALVLTGCTATQWTKEGATTADLDRDYDDCRLIAKPDPAIATAFGVFGAVGVFAGTSVTDSKIRSCMQARGWAAPGSTNEAAAAATRAPEFVKTAEPESPAAARLKELKLLLDRGLITKQEYDEKRQSILRGL